MGFVSLMHHDHRPVLTDIRCGCGGLCDSSEPCPMRANVEACRCGYTAIVHARSQQGCQFFGGYDWQTDPLGLQSTAGGLTDNHHQRRQPGPHR